MAPRPINNYAATWAATLFLGAAPVVAWLCFPDAFAFVLLFAIYLIPCCWRWYYSEWVEGELYSQPQETIGHRAVLVHLRIAICGALAGIGVTLLCATSLNRDLSSPAILLACGTFLTAVPLSFVIPKIKSVLLAVLKAVCEVPFNIAIVWMGLTTEQDYIRRKFKTLNSNGKILFSRISGYSSNLSILHEADYILRQLPKRS